MRRCAVWATLFLLTIGLPACGKYGAPVRSLPEQTPSTSEATEGELQEPEEQNLRSTDFEEAEADEESGP